MADRKNWCWDKPEYHPTEEVIDTSMAQLQALQEAVTLLITLKSMSQEEFKFFSYDNKGLIEDLCDKLSQVKREQDTCAQIERCLHVK